MRKVFLLIFTFLFLSCSTYDYVVDSDYSYSGKFNRYRSFSFVNNPGFAGERSDQQIIEKSLGTVLQAWGYKYKEKKPDLYVIYSIYFEDFNFTGFHQPDFRLWLGQNFRRQPAQIKGDTLDNEDDRAFIRNHIREDYDEQNVRLTEGTVLVSFIDRKKSQTVWQGYASGVFNNDQAQNDRVIRAAIIQILDEYKILAFEKAS
ncbi:MAG: DUF4136 domain-containing protein [Bacteroidota bacterium]